ncbi:hypothetical protein SAMN05216355_106107 [Actinomyces ruminicola]|uniref:Uncharacterized protein n=1 Tax=Actinomyces ruminicola TaxID=332524 RepID=A0A1H0CCH1_9ACTO|nr:hypothetical protein [Actinomyces ruminicola]SDN55513.1 hypothetical protein SAMN05216355_106107 [Actinomyces ruminicola]
MMVRIRRASSTRPAARPGITGRLRRRAALPPALAALVPADGRLLGAVPLTDDDSRWAVATAHYLTVVGPDGVELHRGWHEVEHGRWDADATTFTLTWTDDSRPLLLVVPAALSRGERSVGVDVAPFARALRQGVESALVHSVTGQLPSGQRVTVSVRRDVDGRLYTTSNLPARAAGDLERADADALADLHRRVRDGVGLPTN